MITLVAPCFNEELTIVIFLKKLEEILVQLDEQFHVVIVDDCSQDSTYKLLSEFEFKGLNIRYDVLHLKFNLGNQGAIYQGLLYAHSLNADYVIIMDADGEDDPEAIPLLLKQKEYEIVVVKRGKRSESLLFKLSYFFYKIIFRLITKRTIDYGNYCLIDKNILERIKYTSFIHLPAYLLKQKAKRTDVTFNRSQRIDGESKVGYKGLLMHAFKSMIEFGEDLLLLFLRIFIIIMIMFVALLGNILYQKFISNTAILGWASTLAISLLILAMLCLGFFIVGVLLLNLIHQQNNKSFKDIYTISKLHQQ